MPCSKMPNIFSYPAFGLTLYIIVVMAIAAVASQCLSDMKSPYSCGKPNMPTNNTLQIDGNLEPFMKVSKNLTKILIVHLMYCLLALFIYVILRFVFSTKVAKCEEFVMVQVINTVLAFVEIISLGLFTQTSNTPSVIWGARNTFDYVRQYTTTPSEVFPGSVLVPNGDATLNCILKVNYWHNLIFMDLYWFFVFVFFFSLILAVLSINDLKKHSHKTILSCDTELRMRRLVKVRMGRTMRTTV
ncbi:hypothetical protein L596_021978 [Steinernema carpocapsae]|uniref:Uncharacterized protein n=1 Tax=Steinernema carpocapsae TaxID=34508 RepID=A0A4U5MKC7_STECR|nr:hypothetical protein L596_021978 [Steinernema carpocapsae]